MKKIFLFVLIFVGVLYPQINKINLLISKAYYNYTPVTGSATVSADMVQIFGSETRTVNSKKISNYTIKAPQRWMRVVGVDSSQGLSKILYGLTGGTQYTYYHSILQYNADGSTVYKKGANATFITPPNSPTNYFAVAGNKLINFSYTNPTGLFDSLYFYYKKTGDANYTIVKIDSGTAAPVQVTGLTAHSVYETFMRSKKGANLSASTDIIYCTPYNILYVDNAATGTNNGTSWANAYKSFTDINWLNITGIDTLYISGGTDSTVYAEALFVGGGNENTGALVDVSGTSGHPLVITKGKDAGHNGKVVIDGENTRWNLIVIGLDYIKIIDIKVKNPLRQTKAAVEPPTGVAGRAVYFDYANFVELDSCEIVHDNSVGMIMFESDNCKLLYNSFHHSAVLDTASSSFSLEFSRGCDNIEIAYNTFINQNEHDGAPTYCHKPIIMTSGVTPVNVNGSVHHNFFMHNVTTQPTYSGGVELQSLQGTWYFYNNVIADKGGSIQKALVMNAYSSTGNTTIKVYNNTILAEGSADNAIEIDDADSIYFYNNIVYKPNGSIGMKLVNGTYMAFDYNRYYCSGGNIAAINGGSWNNITSWQALGYDTHGSSGAVTFANLWGTSVSDYLATGAWTGIGLGVANTIATDDILGIARPQGSAWDMGAFER